MDVSIPFADLTLQQRIGKGSFGSVHVGDYLGTRVAVKQVHEVEDADLQKYFEREVSTLAAARHPNVVQFMGVSKDDRSNLYIVTEFCDGKGDLRQLNESEELPWLKRAEIALGIARAMAFLHARGIIHRDMKSENVLITSDYVPKVCDFGFARPKETSRSKKVMTMCGTDWTMAPEIILCMDYNELVDVFSFGMVLGELFSRIKPSTRHFKRVIPGFGLDETEVRSLIQPGCPPALVDLTLRCLEDSPRKRPPFVDVVKRLQAAVEQLKTASVAPADTVKAQVKRIDAPTPAAVPETAPAAATAAALAALLAGLSLDAASDHADEVEGVLVHRYDVRGAAAATLAAAAGAEPIHRYTYVVENKLGHDVRVILRVEGTAVHLVPGEAPAKPYPRGAQGPPSGVDCVVERGKVAQVARVLALPGPEVFAYKLLIQCTRAHVDVRRSENNGVTLETRIFAQPDAIELSFYAVSTKPAPVTITVDLTCEGGLDPGNENPLVTVLPANSATPVCVGRVRSSKPVGYTWKWAAAKSGEDGENVWVMNGVRLTTRNVPGTDGREIEFFADNTRAAPVSIALTLTGPLNGAAADTTVRIDDAVVAPGETRLLQRVSKAGDLVVDWRWSELPL